MAEILNTEQVKCIADDESQTGGGFHRNGEGES